jgi:DNA-binding MarR family transcriptional regulator
MPARTAATDHPPAARHPRIADIRDLLTFRIAMLAAANDRMGQSWLKGDFGLRVLEWRVLGLTVALEPVRFGAIARRLRLDKGQLSRLVKALVQRGLVSTRTDDKDQRILRLTATSAGQALHDRVLSKALARNELIASALNAEEVATLFALLDKLQPFMDHRVDEVEAATAD